MKKQIFFCLEYPKNGITATTGGGEEAGQAEIYRRQRNRVPCNGFRIRIQDGTGHSQSDRLIR